MEGDAEAASEFFADGGCALSFRPRRNATVKEAHVSCSIGKGKKLVGGVAGVRLRRHWEDGLQNHEPALSISVPACFECDGLGLKAREVSPERLDVRWG